MARQGTHEVAFMQMLQDAGLPAAQVEYRFCSARRWRFDFAWPDYRLAIEIDGGAWIQGRHNRGRGFVADREKDLGAFRLGWCVLHITPEQMPEAIDALRNFFNTNRGEQNECK